MYTDLNILKLSSCKALSVCLSLTLTPIMSPVAVASTLSSPLPPTHYSVSICPWCPHSPPSPALSLSGTADGDYGPVLPFVLGPQRDLWLFWTAHSSAPHISYKMQAPFFSLKKEAAECTLSEYICWTGNDCRGLKCQTHLLT